MFMSLSNFFYTVPINSLFFTFFVPTLATVVGSVSLEKQKYPETSELMPR